ncbi:major facilitator superfamily domain-containing protein [Aspergillus affinis]|uniref:major facilitator superfamily domain-containing protein n=1 Tax=Aspergillus affinis TaxID=1070780 RepID=UPI0022FE7B58|nr:major facilitator superfamily domain-containing protein [Aspergillus affinis]KAI9042843.1 major facilitator superfamily domain-containing protein [Aspergillus affinis]
MQEPPLLRAEFHHMRKGDVERSARGAAGYSQSGIRHYSTDITKEDMPGDSTMLLSVIRGSAPLDPITQFPTKDDGTMAPSCPSSSDKGQVDNLEDVEMDEATAKKLLRKIDWKLMPVMCFTYALQYYDKAVLSQVAIFGLREDLEIEDGLKYSPEEASGFTDQERQLLLERIRSNNSSGENRDFKSYQLKEGLMDYQLLAILVLSITSTTGSGAVTTFDSIIFHDMGFDTFTSLLMNLPIGVLAFICILGSGFLGRKFAGARLYIIASSCLPVILGCALLWQLPALMLAGRIVGFYLINFFSSAWSQCIGLGTSNAAGHTKNAVYAASTFVGYSIGNIIGPLIFDIKYSPRHNQSFTGLMVCFSICFCASFALRWALVAENRSRDTDTSTQSPIESSDLTDKENKRFRYNL